LLPPHVLPSAFRRFMSRPLLSGFSCKARYVFLVRFGCRPLRSFSSARFAFSASPIGALNS
jgi:hypothetical protein